MTKEEPENRLFNLTEKDTLLIDGDPYKFKRDFYRSMPKFGRMLHREFLRKSDGKKQWFTRNLDLENVNGFWRIKSETQTPKE